MSPSRPRSARPFRVVALWMGVMALGVVAVAVVGYFVYLRYDRVAARHLPRDTLAAVRVDVGQAVLYEPVRTHLFPVFVETLGLDEGSEPWRRFEAQSGFRRRDLREIVVGWGTGIADWVIVLNGLFPKAGLSSLGKALGDGWSVDGDRLVRRGSPAFLAQAPDGAVVLAPSAQRLRAALEGSGQDTTLGLDSQAYASGSARGPSVAGLVRAVLPGADLGAIGRVTATVRPVEPMEIAFRFYALAPAGTETVRRQVDDLLSRARTAAHEAPGRDLGGERAVLERARITEESDCVVISSEWTRAEVDRAAASLAAALRTRRALSQGAAPSTDRGASPPDE